MRLVVIVCLLSLNWFDAKGGVFRADVTQIIATNLHAVILLVSDSPMIKGPRILAVSVDGSAIENGVTNKVAAHTVTNVLRELQRIGFFDLDDKKVRERTRSMDDAPNRDPKAPRGYQGFPIAADGSQETLRVCYDGRTNVFTWPHVASSLWIYPAVKELKTFNDSVMLVATNFPKKLR